jgi:hypothetical protein
MSEQAFIWLDRLMIVIMISVAWFIIWVAFLSPLVLWVKYKRWARKDIPKAERHIAKMNKELDATEKVMPHNPKDDELNITIPDNQQATEKIIFDNQPKELMINDEEKPLIIKTEDKVKIDYKSKNIIELKMIAKEHHIRGYSRMKKSKLIEILTSH